MSKPRQDHWKDIDLPERESGITQKAPFKELYVVDNPSS
jgi:hypothetical protein